MNMNDDKRAAAEAVRTSLIAKGIDPRRARHLVRFAVSRVAASGMSGCDSGCACCACCGSRSGLGAAQSPLLQAAPTPPTAAVAGAPGIVADLSAAGDSPAVSSARDLVSKWSWLIPVCGLIMSAKDKAKSFISGSQTTVGKGRR